jgi:hypothetical protein
MTKNVGKTDALLRFLLACFLVWLGLFPLDGLDGSSTGLLVAAASLLPFTMAMTRSCPLFSLFGYNSLPKDKRAESR